MGGNERDDGPRNEADRLLNFFPSAQAIGADDIDLRFGFVGLAAFNNLRKVAAGKAPRTHRAMVTEAGLPMARAWIRPWSGWSPGTEGRGFGARGSGPLRAR